MHPDAPYFSILLCLTPDNFTHQVESAATQWVEWGLWLQQVFGVGWGLGKGFGSGSKRLFIWAGPAWLDGTESCHENFFPDHKRS
jgi:hypothetical protein